MIAGVPSAAGHPSTAHHSYAFLKSGRVSCVATKHQIAGVPSLRRELHAHPITAHHSFVFSTSREGSRCASFTNKQTNLKVISE